MQDVEVETVEFRLFGLVTFVHRRQLFSRLSFESPKKIKIMSQKHVYYYDVITILNLDEYQHISTSNTMLYPRILVHTLGLGSSGLDLI
jgi:hypothetical protein